MCALGIVPDPKGKEAHFQDFAYVVVLKRVGPSEKMLVQKEKKYSLGTFSSGRRLHTIPYHTIPYHTIGDAGKHELIIVSYCSVVTGSKFLHRYQRERRS